jgi:hypothetical protein
MLVLAGQRTMKVVLGGTLTLVLTAHCFQLVFQGAGKAQVLAVGKRTV